MLCHGLKFDLQISIAFIDAFISSVRQHTWDSKNKKYLYHVLSDIVIIYLSDIHKYFKFAHSEF